MPVTITTVPRTTAGVIVSPRTTQASTAAYSGDVALIESDFPGPR
jgi:hypothetical protein